MEELRKNTISMTFTVAKPTTEDLVDFLGFLKVDLKEVVVIQEEFGGTVVHVKLCDSEKTRVKIEEILKFPGRQFVSQRCEQCVFLTRNGAQVSYVKVRNLPPEVSDATLRGVLSEFGACLDMQWDRFKSGPLKGIRNGTRNVTMALKFDVPSYILVGECEVVVEYAGQPRTCRICDSPDHLRAKCPERFATGAGEAADAASPAEDEPAGGDEGEEEEEVAVTRASSEPPPTTTSADVMLPAADAPPAAATSPRANTSQAEQQEPAAGEQTTAGGEARVLEGADGPKEFGKNLLEFSEVLRNGNKNNVKKNKRGASGSPDGGGVQTRRSNKKPALKRY